MINQLSGLLLVISLGCINGQELASWSWDKTLNDQYNLTAMVNVTAQRVYFKLALFADITENEKMWLGIGLSPESGIAEGADFVISKNSDKNTLLDYFAVNKTDWILDTIDANEDDWEQIEYSSNEGENITFCSITRAFKTQNVTEGEDREIKDENVYVLWAYGPLDADLTPNYSANTTVKGSFRLNLMRPFVPSSANVNLTSFISGTAFVVILALIKSIVNM